MKNIIGLMANMKWGVHKRRYTARQLRNSYSITYQTYAIEATKVKRERKAKILSENSFKRDRGYCGHNKFGAA